MPPSHWGQAREHLAISPFAPSFGFESRLWDAEASTATTTVTAILSTESQTIRLHGDVLIEMQCIPGRLRSNFDVSEQPLGNASLIG